MNGNLSLVSAYSKALRSCQFEKVNLVFCPSFTLIDSCYSKLSKHNVFVGAQNCSHLPSGSFTGEVSATMLAEANCKYVVVGHSERRKLETNDEVIQKATIAIQNGIYPIVCIGESKGEDRKKIIEDSCSMLPEGTIIAYEPLWSIGTGCVPTATEVKDVVSYIKSIIPSKVLYGGSVTANNALDFVTIGMTDGLLIGKASLDPKEFLSIAKTLDSI